MTTAAQADSKLVDRIEEVGAKIGRVRETTGSTIFGQGASSTLPSSRFCPAVTRC